MKKFISLLALGALLSGPFLSGATHAQGVSASRGEAVRISIAESVEDSRHMLFIERDNGLALNVDDYGIRALRESIAEGLKLERPLKFFTGWEIDGEAHVTVITPPEYARLKDHVGQREIDQIAVDMDIQGADLRVLGLGSGRKAFGQEIGETFFVIVSSRRLLQIREEIGRRFVARGGQTANFNPRHFFPHVTIGYTHADIHEPEIFKDMARALDPRFNLVVEAIR